MQRQRFLLAALLAAFIASNVVTAPGQAMAQMSAASGEQEGKTTDGQPVSSRVLHNGHTVAQKTTATNPTATVHDYDSSGTPLLLRSDDYNGTDQATYTTSSSRGSSLSSTFVNGGEWNLNLAHQSLRTLYITPNAAIDNSQPPGPPAGNYWDGVTSRCGCFDQNGNRVPLANVVTSSGNCNLGVNFVFGGESYKLLMSPFPLSGSGDPPPTCPSTGCPSTGVVTVTCNAVSNGQCVNWTFEPNVTAPNANVANLYRLSSTGPRTSTWVFIGQYYNSFRIGLTNP